jgi:N-acetylmuramoyl-L-alanine amidase-like protein
VHGLRLHFVNTTGTATRGARLRTRLRGIATAAVSAVRNAFDGSASAQPAQPPIVSREDWGAGACPPRADPAFGDVKVAFVHHTVSTNDYGPDESAAMVLAMCRYHRNSNGWNDIGYNFLVDRYGTIFEGRAGGVAEAVVGAQAQGYNSQSTGIASIGTFSSGGQTEAGLRALANLLGWKLGLHGVPAHGRVALVSGGGSLNRYPAGSRPMFERISGHRDADATACPGDGLYDQLSRLRATVAPGPPRATTATAAQAARPNVPYGQKAVLNLGLTASGAPLGGKRLTVQLLGRLGWRNQYSVSTDAQGRAETRLRVSTNRTLRARYGGEAGLLPSSSAPVKVGVRPRVSLALAAPDPVRLSGAIRPRKSQAILTLKRRTATGRLVRVSRRGVRLRKGRLRIALRLRRPALYRARLSVRRDARNLAARSSVVTFRVGANRRSHRGTGPSR